MKDKIFFNYRSYQHQAATKQNPIPLELDSAAYPVNGDAKKASKHKNWKERVEKASNGSP